MKERFSAYINQLQDRITSTWRRSMAQVVFKSMTGIGQVVGVDNRVSSRMECFEKGGVNVSNVFGELPDSMKSYLKG
ncbi:MAG: hypothetical protein CM15mP83_7320 [Flavobacteriaceae bacterium]|nr:MAG: hypothetical protein CM15mP83_7320 [Flavobacteriaceae bacterium]